MVLLLLILPFVVVTVTHVLREQRLPVTHINVAVTQYYPLNVLTMRYNLLICIKYHRFQCNFAFEKCVSVMSFSLFLSWICYCLDFLFFVVVVVSLYLCLCPATRLMRHDVKKQRTEFIFTGTSSCILNLENQTDVSDQFSRPAHFIHGQKESPQSRESNSYSSVVQAVIWLLRTFSYPGSCSRSEAVQFVNFPNCMG